MADPTRPSRRALGLFGVAAALQAVPTGAEAAAAPADAPVPPPAPGVAVVDLDRVAQDIGWATKLQADLDRCRTQLIDEVRQALNAAAGDPPARDRLAAQLSRAGDEKFNAYRSASFRAVRDALLPIVRRIAQEKRLQLVMTRTDVVIYTAPDIDITNDVTDAVRANPPQLPVVPMPHVDGGAGGDATTRPSR